MRALVDEVTTHRSSLCRAMIALLLLQTSEKSTSMYKCGAMPSSWRPL